MPQMWLLSFHPRTNIHVIIIIIFVIMTDSDLNQYKQIGTRPGDRCDMRLSRISLTKCIWRVERAGDHFGLGFTWIGPLLTKMCEKKRFLQFRSQWPDLWPLYHKFARLVTLVQRYVFTKLEVSKTFLFRENRRHGTDGQGTTLDAVSA